VAGIYCTGPVAIYVGVPTAAAQQLPPSAWSWADPTATRFTAANVFPAAAAAPAAGKMPLALVGLGLVDATPAPQAVPVAVSYTIMLLGFAERGPEIEIVPAHELTFIDERGGRTPADAIYDGETAWIRMDLSAWDESVYSLCARRVSAAGPRGVNGPGSLGTMLLAEGALYPLYLVFPYARKATQTDMPSAYRFAGAVCHGPDRLAPLGTRPRKLRLLWQAFRIPLPGGTLLLYDTGQQLGRFSATDIGALLRAPFA
jgi:hypothetical protein